MTDSCVTVLILKTTDEYYGLLMNKKIDAVWLTIERMAELKGCSSRTVWRYIKMRKMHTVKRQVKIGTAKVLKTFILPDPETLELEFSDTYKKRLMPEHYLETVIPIGERMVKSMLVYAIRIRRTGMVDYKLDLDEYRKFYAELMSPTDEDGSGKGESSAACALEHADEMIDVEPDMEMSVSKSIIPFQERDLNLRPKQYIPYKKTQEAKLMASFCQIALSRLDDCVSKIEEWQLITQEYNKKILLPELYALRGKRDERSLRDGFKTIRIAIRTCMLWLERAIPMARPER